MEGPSASLDEDTRKQNTCIDALSVDKGGLLGQSMREWFPPASMRDIYNACQKLNAMRFVLRVELQRQLTSFQHGQYSSHATIFRAEKHL